MGNLRRGVEARATTQGKDSGWDLGSFTNPYTTQLRPLEPNQIGPTRSVLS